MTPSVERQNKKIRVPNTECCETVNIVWETGWEGVQERNIMRLQGYINRTDNMNHEETRRSEKECIKRMMCKCVWEYRGVGLHIAFPRAASHGTPVP